MTAGALNKKNEALQYFKRAEDLDDKIGICKYQKATVLFSMERLKEALIVLEQLQKICPKEAAAHIL